MPKKGGEMAGHGPAHLWGRPRRHSQDLLLVEPYRNTRSALAEILSLHRLSVVPASTKDEALERAEVRSLDAIITEVVFPDQEPCELFIQTLRRLQPEALIIVTSGIVGCENLCRFGYDDPIPRVRQGGADLCLAKPVDMTRLLDALGSARPAACQRAQA